MKIGIALVGILLVSGAGAQEVACGAAGAGAGCRREVRLIGSGADLSARILETERGLGAGGVMLVLDQQGTIGTAVKLRDADSLQVRAAVTMTAVMTLGSGSRVSCAKAGSLRVVKGAAFETASNGVEVDHCTATGDATDEASLLVTHGARNVQVHDNTLRGIGVVHGNDGAGLNAVKNTVVWPGNTPGYGVVWSNVANVLVDGNSFMNVRSAVEFFNADANGAKGGPTTRAEVLKHPGGAVISNNTCSHSEACYWGSVGHDVLITGNEADHCSDVCYDFEGSVDAKVTGNKGRESGNGVGAVFFFSDHVEFSGNDFGSSTGSPLISIHNDTQRPDRNRFLVVKNNTLTCTGKICPAVTGDPSGDLTFAGNHLTNAFVALGQYGGTMSITQNDLHFTIAGAAKFTAIEGPNLLNGASLTIAGNVIDGVTQPDGSVCLGDTSSDFNSNVAIVMTENRCVGGFPVDVRTVNAGGNPGTGVSTTLTGNLWGHGRVEHEHATGNRDSYLESSQAKSR